LGEDLLGAKKCQICVMCGFLIAWVGDKTGANNVAVGIVFCSSVWYNDLTNLNLTKECDCMKKLIALVLALVCVLSLCSCGWNSQKAVATIFSQNVTKVDIAHRIGTETTNWSIEGTELASLREWFNNLDYKLIEVKDGQSPGDSNGNEVYNFAFTGGECLGFSYVINGENDCYILNPEGYWFSVSNPTNPPVSEPTK
jgi:hypothetical protein